MIKPIKYRVYNTTIRNSLPIIVTQSYTDIEGTIDIWLEDLTVSTISATVYRVEASGDRWNKVSADLYTANILDYSHSGDNVIRIEFRFDPAVIPASNGQYYALTWYINSLSDVTTKKITAQLVVSIEDDRL